MCRLKIPEVFLTWADDNDCNVTVTHLYNDENLPKHDDYDWLVVMGGPMNIYDEKNYPWLSTENSFILELLMLEKLL